MPLFRRDILRGSALLVASLIPGTIRAAVEKLLLSNSEWKQRLTSKQYYILREDGTERPWSSSLNDEKRQGIYHCAACDLELFSSETKYDSGTGWPSFWSPIQEHVGTKNDYKLLWPRTEYHCARCEGHQGHIFNDGPPPTGKRYCNNGDGLIFKLSSRTI